MWLSSDGGCCDFYEDPHRFAVLVGIATGDIFDTGMTDVSKMVTITGAAEIARVTRRAIQASIERGELAAETTADGKTRLVKLSQVEKWKDRPAGVGRPRGSGNQ